MIGSYVAENLMKLRVPAITVGSFSYGGTRKELVPEKMRTVNSDGQSIRRAKWCAEYDRGLAVELEMKAFDDFEAVEWMLHFRNVGEVNTRNISDIMTVDLGIPTGEEEVSWESIKGDDCSQESFMPLSRPFKSGDRIEVAPSGGRSSNMSFPFFDLKGDQNGLICAIGWSGQWKYEITREEQHMVLKVGLEHADFYLKPGETARSPRILIMPWKGDSTDAHNRFRRLMRTHYSPKARLGDDFRLPVSLQNFDRYTWNMPFWNTEEGQIKGIELAAQCRHLDTYWLDAAWFTGGFPLGVGNYRYREGFPRGLKPVSDEAHRKGLKFMVWFEPERVSEGTEVYLEHPEWLIQDESVVVEWTGGQKKQALFNLGIPEAREWLVSKIAGLIMENGIDVYRQDFNIDPLAFWQVADEEGRKGLAEIKYIEGFYRLWDDLLERFPGLFIDNCASGGRRIDLETCMRSVPMWRSDTGCFPLSLKWPSDQWNQNQTICLSRYIPYFATAAWNADAYEFRSAAAKGIAVDFDVFSESFDFDQAAEALKEQKHLSRYWEGDFYPLAEANQDEKHWSGFQFHIPEEDSGMVMLFRRVRSPYPSAVFSLKGVKPQQQYRLLITDEDRKSVVAYASGRELLEGYVFSIDQPRKSVVLEYGAYTKHI